LRSKRALSQAATTLALASAGFFLSVTCTEDVPFIDVKMAEDAARSTFGGDYRLQQQLRACGLWSRGWLSHPRGQAVRSDVPALLFSGDQDPVTPPARVAEVLRHLTNARHVVVANNGHAFGSLGNATPSVFHQRHIGRVLRSSWNRGRRLASSRGREPRQADALLFGRVTYEMMEAAWRPAGADGSEA
jgi:hypothetical protein